MEEADLVGAALDNHPIYLMSALGMIGLLSCSISALIWSNFSISIELVRIPCAIMPYVGVCIEAPFPILLVYSLANCLSVPASSVLMVLMLRSPLFSWFADTTWMFSMCLFLLCSIARSAWLCRVRGFFALRFSMVVGSVIFTMISRCAWIRDDVCVEIVIGLLICETLLLSTEAYELLGVGEECMAFAMSLISFSSVDVSLPAIATSLVIAFVSWHILMACCDDMAVCWTVAAVVWTVVGIPLPFPHHAVQSNPREKAHRHRREGWSYRHALRCDEDNTLDASRIHCGQSWYCLNQITLQLKGAIPYSSNDTQRDLFQVSIMFEVAGICGRKPNSGDLSIKTINTEDAGTLRQFANE